jgi:hypothetical protein
MEQGASAIDVVTQAALRDTATEQTLRDAQSGTALVATAPEVAVTATRLRGPYDGLVVAAFLAAILWAVCA